ncbi:MAG: EAL domain-containing protein, partial [Pseudomonadota bacterium]
EGQVISPAEFIPIAEEIGLIGQLDLAVLKRAIALVQPLMKTANRQYRLSVNVSAKDFKTDAFVHHIQHVLHSSGFDPHLLTLEITESVFLEDWSAACARLELLQNMGLKIALDDFGTGYSSLSYLMQFSFDIIKIDRTFLQRLEEDRARLILLNHIIKLATNLGKTVVAEGVERPDQAMKVSRLGAHVLQGALFGLDIEDAPELLVQSDRKSGLHAGATR